MIAAKLLYEALLVSVYALAFNAAALLVGLPLFVGADGMARHAGFGLLLLVLATVAVFGTALVALRRRAIDSPLRGALLGLLAAGLFYALIVILFGLVPALASLSGGDAATAAGYVGDVTLIALEGSHGLPAITGALGGALYGWLRGRTAGARR